MNIENLLKNSGKNITPERKALFEFLQTKHIFSPADLLQEFSNLGRASIFRTLNLFLELGIIRKLNIGEKGESYELNDETHHHEHMKCEKCHGIISFESQDICKQIVQEAQKIGFRITSHNIGILGTCRNCLLNNY